MTGIGLLACAVVMPMLARIWSFPSAVVLGVLQAGTFAMVATPSLTFMADATSEAGVGSFGAAYGVYNTIWAVGLLSGPALGGYLFERVRFQSLMLGWSAVIVLITIALPIFRSAPTARR